MEGISPVAVTAGLTPDKSARDQKDYKLVQIGELEVLLVSNVALQSADNADGESAKGSAAMSVQVGSFADPASAEGMAHFLEHMVFMGSEKYPNENHYDAFVTAHGGFCNAFTEGEFTAYQFDVDSDFFAEGLDIFAQCFISPLLKKESIEREIKAINSEFNVMISSKFRSLCTLYLSLPFCSSRKQTMRVESSSSFATWRWMPTC